MDSGEPVKQLYTIVVAWAFAFVIVVNRRQLLAFALARGSPFRPIVISVNVICDRGGHFGKGLAQGEIARFWQYQETARREYTTSGIHFDVHVTEGAFLRKQGYSDIPDRFLLPKTINLFVTDTLGYDIDRDRTGGCS